MAAVIGWSSEIVMNKRETAQQLVRWHRADRMLQCVLLLEPLAEDDPSEPIRLLTIVAETPERGIERLYFHAAPDHNVPYPSVIVEVPPAEFEQLRDASSDLASSLHNRNWAIGAELPNM